VTRRRALARGVRAALAAWACLLGMSPGAVASDVVVVAGASLQAGRVDALIPFEGEAPFSLTPFMPALVSLDYAAVDLVALQLESTGVGVVDPAAAKTLFYADDGAGAPLYEWIAPLGSAGLLVSPADPAQPGTAARLVLTRNDGRTEILSPEQPIRFAPEPSGAAGLAAGCVLLARLTGRRPTRRR